MCICIFNSIFYDKWYKIHNKQKQSYGNYFKIKILQKIDKKLNSNQHLLKKNKKYQCNWLKKQVFIGINHVIFYKNTEMTCTILAQNCNKTCQVSLQITVLYNTSVLLSSSVTISVKFIPSWRLDLADYQEQVEISIFNWRSSSLHLLCCDEFI